MAKQGFPEPLKFPFTENRKILSAPNEQLNDLSRGAAAILHFTIGVDKSDCSMPEQNSTRSFEKIRRIYSERRQKEVSVRISYDVTDMHGGQLVQLKNVEVLES